MGKEHTLVVLFSISLILLLPSYISLNNNIIPSASATGPVLYGADATSNLFTINPTTSAIASPIGSIGTSITGMDFDSSGSLFGVNIDVISINLSTGAGTFVFPRGTPSCNGGFAFDPIIASTSLTGAKFLCNVFLGGSLAITSLNPSGDFNSEVTPSLDSSDLSTIGGTTVGSDNAVYFADQYGLYKLVQPITASSSFTSPQLLDFSALGDTNCGVTSLSFDPSGTLFAAVTCNTNHYLATINTSTGVVSKIGSLSGLTAIAFGNAVVLQPDFSLSATSPTIQAGSSGNSIITITPMNGFNSAVSLTVSGNPSGVTTTFSSNPTSTTSTLTINVGSSVSPGTYTLTVTGNSGTLTHSTTISLTVSSPPNIQAMKKSVLTNLGILVPVNKDDRHNLQEAIEQVMKSVGPTLWNADGNHLNTKTGDQVFDDEKHAVQHLMDIIKNKKENTQFNNIVNNGITQLVSADKNLAQTVITQASNGVPRGDSTQDVAQAQKEMINASVDISKGHYDAAIDHYKNAWKEALDAIQDETTPPPHNH